MLLYSILGNDIKKYVIAIGIMFFLFVLGQIISKFLGKYILKRLSLYTDSNDLKMFDSLMVKPMTLVFIIVMSFFVAKLFAVPESFEINLFKKISLSTFLFKSWLLLFSAAGIWLFLRIVDYIIYLLLQKAIQTQNTHDEQILFFLKDILKIIIILCGMLFILGYVFNLDVRSLIGAAGIATLAIALASKETIENLFASITIFLENPYSVGDVVKVYDTEGVVEKIGFRSTLIRSNNKTLVSIPNKKMIDNTTENQSNRTSRVVSQTLHFNSNLSTESLKKLMEDMKNIYASYGETIISHFVFLKDFDKGLITLETSFSTQPIPLDDLKELKQKINLDLLEVFEKNKAQLEKLSN